ncbi:MAG: YraN family protein [Methyloprofundus sp.]|nr:YraN family protein [Methyloprofundus sp.]
MQSVKQERQALTHLQKGEKYEDFALQYLLEQGLSLVERNYRCRMGELDLIMQEKEALVIIEVRYRANDRYGSASESVSKKKQARIIAATKHYIVTHKVNRPMRFDVVAITGDSPLNWIKNAF